MRRKSVAIVAGVVAAAFAGPGAGVASADFVCPVLPISQQAKDHTTANGQLIEISGGDASILPGEAGDMADSPVGVPSNATNLDGAGSPGGAHAAPGEGGYTAIWDG